MNLWRRILAVVIMILSVLMIILSAGGIAGNWFINNTVTHGVVRVLTGVDLALGELDAALGRIDSRLADARAAVATLEESVTTAGEDFAENPVLLTRLSENVDLGIAPAVENLRETVQSIRETIIAIQNTIEAINALPFVSLDDRVSEPGQLQRLSEGITALGQGVQEVRDGIREAKAEVVARVVSRMTSGTSRLDNALATIETATADYQAQVLALRTQAARLQSELTLWLDVASVVITVALLWVILSQVVTFVFGLSVYRNENLFARWLGATTAQPSE